MVGGGAGNSVSFFSKTIAMLELGQHHVSEQFTASQACSQGGSAKPPPLDLDRSFFSQKGSHDTNSPALNFKLHL